ncbi:tail fiber assembly protein [Edwardsiella tarda]|nr:tail fiber assembly protein [Edwardsiella tarda]
MRVGAGRAIADGWAVAQPEEESALKEWKIYRVLLNRVDTSLGAAVVWPTPPASPAR